MPGTTIRPAVSATGTPRSPRSASPPSGPSSCGCGRTDVIQEIAQLLRPWKDLYDDSVVLSTSVTTAHVLSLVVGGGFAIAADRTTLRTLSCPGHARPWLL